MITSAIVWMWVFIHVGVVLVAASYFAIGGSIAPRLTARSRRRLAIRPWLPVLVGLIVSLPWMAVAIGLLAAPAAPVKFVGAILAGLWVLAGLLGGAAIAQHVGARQAGTSAWSDGLRGGLLVALTWILPLVGWLVMLPLTLVAGVGCLLTGLRPMPGEGDASDGPSTASAPLAPAAAVTGPAT